MRRMGPDAHRFGRESEAIAERYLKQSGYHIVARNYRTRYGEVDLIAYDGPTLVFVEVKARRSRRFGMPHDAVDRRKQRQLTRVAMAFLAQRGVDVAGSPREEPNCRFDLVIIEKRSRWSTEDDQIELLQDVFSPCWGTV